MARNLVNDSQSASPIRNCSWGYKCENTWDGLIATDNESVRFSDACDKQVFLCKTELELADAVLLNRCVAFPPELLHRLATDSSGRHIHKEQQDNKPDDSDCFSVEKVIAEYRIETRHD